MHRDYSAASTLDHVTDGSLAAAPTTRVVYSERLWVPLWYWVAALVVAGLLSAEVHMGSPGVLTWLPYVVLVPFAVWGALHLSRTRVEITDGPEGRVLHVGKAHLPVAVVSRVAVVPPSAKSAALGRQLDPAAFVQHRTWVKPMVIVVLDDPEDSTPYWLVSSRHPEKVADALVPPTA
ncbi:hypothetical protein GCM10007304_23240 [Rhodococcoides trifolii]|uniref:DUF3093 domain-containing protein n=1 Tax=Rhodococcoides trifolii TaxID=908250 RepID=A0A917D4G0_9NOCA|nr:hypothetical protein GCM10007304_23240 [Rhodococcus trifolii]